jgi:hypothetical protein
VLPLVALATVAGIISLGLAVLASWAVLTIFLLILEAGAEAHDLQPRAVLRMDRKQPIPNAIPKDRRSRLSSTRFKGIRITCP